jgi:phage tail sheath protein FI
VNVKERLREPDRDDLYEVNINPIAKFPAGIYVFGQKTLQATPSALDRINVRRLMNFVKVGVEKRARSILFDPNNAVTWDKFRNSIEPFLADIKSRFGLQDYRIVLDETTTTPDLVDRNILYAKIELKPERAIEFIAIDFVLTNTGLGFDD